MAEVTGSRASRRPSTSDMTSVGVPPEWMEATTTGINSQVKLFKTPAACVGQESQDSGGPQGCADNHRQSRGGRGGGKGGRRGEWGELRDRVGDSGHPRLMVPRMSRGYP